MPRGNVDLNTRVQRIEAGLASLAMALLKEGRAEEAIGVMEMAQNLQGLKANQTPHRKVS